MKNEKLPKKPDVIEQSDAELLSRSVKDLYNSLSQLGSLVLQLQLSGAFSSRKPVPPPPPIQLEASSTLH